MIDLSDIKTRFEGLKDMVLVRVGKRRRRQGPSPIVPDGSVTGNALVIVIAIMTFLACLTLGGVTLVRASAAAWQSQIAREATIQIRPVEGQDIERELQQASEIARGFAGVKGTAIIDKEATARLLEPWLGSGLNIDELPVPRLVVVTIDENAPPDFESMRAELTRAIPAASFDDHRTWVYRLVSMANTTVLVGTAVLSLVIAATVLTVIFATRGAMSGNGHIIEVLHFIGAESKFVAREFEWHFFRTALKGALFGGAAAMLVFLVFSWWASYQIATPEGDQAAAMFGNFAIGSDGYLGAAGIIILVSILTMLTSRLTVIRQLATMDGPGVRAE
ncbi:ABC transporter permease [Brucella abortus]|uniref:cell division protein FtsX n=1 Tax=Brucella abortus TaxID=235 RepID=UPI0027DE7762|nr:ABC transporter permease [Brucella abortus]MCH1756464.1 ABC transporter permease [Brucella abortus]MCH1761454.1 ABC transporter permease [Brucella abortus]MCH1766660.1 ABC transporter permease [Brucella abortus]